MEAVRTKSPSGLLFATVLVGICAVVFFTQQAALSRVDHHPHSAALATGSSPAGGFAVKGETPLDSNVKSSSIQIESGTVDCQVAADGQGKVSWEVVDTPGVNSKLMEVTVTTDGGVVTVEDDWHGHSWGRKPDVHVTAWLPAKSDLDVELGNGQVSSALDGKLNAEVGNGAVTLSGAPSNLNVEVGNGHLQGTAKLLTGDNSVEVGNGHIDLQLLAGSDAKLEATTGVGKVEASGITGQLTSEFVSSSYSGQVGKGAAALQLEVGHGDVTVKGAGPQL